MILFTSIEKKLIEAIELSDFKTMKALATSGANIFASDEQDGGRTIAHKLSRKAKDGDIRAKLMLDWLAIAYPSLMLVEDSYGSLPFGVDNSSRAQRDSEAHKRSQKRKIFFKKPCACKGCFKNALGLCAGKRNEMTIGA